jgi:integrase
MRVYTLRRIYLSQQYSKSGKGEKAVMEVVRPIKNIRDVELMLQKLGERSEVYRMLFLTGIHTGLRISDLLPLRVRDVRTNYITKIEKKSGRQIRVLINDALRAELDDYVECMPNDRVLFPSREGKNKHLSTSRAWQVINDAAAEVGLENIGTHTMRKTFAYHTYKKTRDLALIMRCLNHRDAATTLRYIGINQAELDGLMDCEALAGKQSGQISPEPQPHPTAQLDTATIPNLIAAINRLAAAIESIGPSVVMR